MTQDELKTLVGRAALKYVVPGEIVGVGTGSTVNKFIEALATMKDQVPGAVSSSVASTERLKAIGVPESILHSIAASDDGRTYRIPGRQTYRAPAGGTYAVEPDGSVIVARRPLP